MSPISKADALALASAPRAVERVETSYGEFVVRALTAGERDEYEGASITEKSLRGKVIQKFNHENMRARLLQMTLVDENGALLFEPSDIPAIGRWPATLADQLFDVARRLGGLDPKDLEELKGN